MIYREWLVMRKALLWFFGIVLALAILSFIATISQAHPSHQSSDTDIMAVPVAWAVGIFAAIFGVALGNASREGARVFWTMPVSRFRAAAEVAAVDLAAITIAFIGTFILGWLWFLAMPLVMPYTVHVGIDWPVTAIGLAFLYAVYGWSALVGVLGRKMAYAGILALPLLLLWTAFAGLGGWAGQMLRGPIAANPIALFTTGFQIIEARAKNFHGDLGPVANSLQWVTPENMLAILLAVAAISCTAAIIVWSRAEVLA